MNAENGVSAALFICECEGTFCLQCTSKGINQLTCTKFKDLSACEVLFPFYSPQMRVILLVRAR